MPKVPKMPKIKSNRSRGIFEIVPLLVPLLAGQFRIDQIWPKSGRQFCQVIFERALNHACRELLNLGKNLVKILPSKVIWGQANNSHGKEMQGGILDFGVRQIWGNILPD